VHLDDVVGLIEWALATTSVRGAVNATAPQPVPMGEFCHTLGRVLHRPSWLPVPAGVLRQLLGEAAEVLLTGQRVIPHVAMNGGYPFRFPELTGAFRACLRR
jgi:NAD dependent epimerase/dehydratase family enzyme